MFSFSAIIRSIASGTPKSCCDLFIFMVRFTETEKSLYCMDTEKGQTLNSLLYVFLSISAVWNATEKYRHDMSLCPYILCTICWRTWRVVRPTISSPNTQTNGSPSHRGAPKSHPTLGPVGESAGYLTGWWFRGSRWVWTTSALAGYGDISFNDTHCTWNQWPVFDRQDS